MARPPGSSGLRDRHSTSEKARAASRGFPRPAEARSSSTGIREFLRLGTELSYRLAEELAEQARSAGDGSPSRPADPTCL